MWLVTVIFRVFPAWMLKSKNLPVGFMMVYGDLWYFIISQDKIFFSTEKKKLIFSYFSLKTFVVGTH